MAENGRLAAGSRPRRVWGYAVSADLAGQYADALAEHVLHNNADAGQRSGELGRAFAASDSAAAHLVLAHSRALGKLASSFGPVLDRKGIAGRAESFLAAALEAFEQAGRADVGSDDAYRACDINLLRHSSVSEILAEISRIASSTLELDEVFDSVAGQVKRLLPADRVSISLVDTETGTFIVRYRWGRETPDRDLAARLPLEGSATGHIVSTCTPIRWPSDKAADRLVADIPGLRAVVDADANSLLSVPLVARAHVVGVLHLSNFSGIAFSEQDVATAEIVAAHIAGAVANAELYARTEKYARERQFLAEIGRIASSSQSLDDVFAQMAEEMCRLIPAQRLSADTVNLDEGTFTVRHAWGVEIEGRTSGCVMTLDGHMTGVVAGAGQTLLVASVEDEPDAIERLPGLGPGIAHGMRSFLSVPMLFRDRVIGVLHLRSAVPNAFDPGHVSLAERVAAQISGTVANEALRESAERHAHEVAVLAEIGRVITSSANVEDVYEQFADMVNGLIPADRIIFVRVDQGAGTFQVSHNWGTALPGRVTGSEYALAGSLTRHIVNTGRSYIISSVEEEPDLLASFPGLEPVVRAGTKSMIGTPLIVGDRVIGTFNVQSATPGMYTAHHVELAESVAAQVSGAIANAELHAAADRLAKEEAVLAEIGRVITSSVKIDDVYERFGNLVNELIPADRMIFLHVDRSAGTFLVRHAWGADLPERLRGSSHKLEGSLAGYIAETRQGHLVASIDDEPDLGERFPGMMATLRAGIKSMVSCPLIAGDEVLGTFHIQSRTPGAYGPQHLALAERIAVQVTGAMSNARLYDQALLLADEREQRARLDAENRELERAIEYKNRFVSSVSHELKTPIASLLACANVLAPDGTDNDDSARAQAVEIMERSCQHLDGLIGDLVDASGLAEGKFVFSLRDIDIHELCAEVLQDMAPMLDAKRQPTEFQPADGDLIVRADSDRIRQVISNLVGNACKYSAPGSPVVVKTRRDGDSVVVSVHDRGIGMSEQDRRQLFQPYFRSEAAASVPGTGLGLYISRELVRAHGGDITVESEEGVGTSIEFTLPIERG